MTQYDVGYFAKINDEEAEQANRLANLLFWAYRPKTVLDVGCATGLYLKPFLEKGVKIYGVDYSDDTVDPDVLLIPKQSLLISDITKEKPTKRADLTICIEVLEHIEQKYSKKAVQYITQTSDTIFFTAAQPGQGGVGHINCQPKQYWEDLFNTKGFLRAPEDEDYIKLIMASGYHMGWLINNLMLFKKAV
jgi:SAM-dependent methyltransferase